MSEHLSVSQEFLTIGGSKALGVELLVLVEQLCTKARDEQLILPDSAFTPITDLIQKKTQLQMDLEVIEDLDLGVYVTVPMGHAGVSGRDKGSMDSGMHPSFHDKWLKSTIDLDRAKVTGQFTKIPFCLLLPRPFFEGVLDLTPEEITAFILHEVGHAFFSLATLGEYVLLNYFLTDGVEVLMGKKPNTYRVEVLDHAYIKRQLSKDEAERLQQDPTEANYRRALLIAHRRTPRTHLVSRQGGVKRDEQLADMFASRMGFSRALATGIYKGTKNRDSRFHRTTLTNLKVETGKFLLAGVAIGGSLMVPVLSPVLVLFYFIVEWADSHNGGDYDNDYQRLVKLRQDLVAQLRHTSSSPQYRTKLDDDIKAIDALLKTMKDRNTTMMALGHLLIPGYRRGRQQLKHEELLESLLNNDLFVQAERFRR